MSHRTQITLTDEQYAILRDESARSGLGLAELVRRAIDISYGPATEIEISDALAASFGAWESDDGSAEEYVEALRPGMAHRLADA